MKRWLNYHAKRLAGRPTRRYPIRPVSKEGFRFKSARQACFRFFDAGLTPAQAARVAGVSARTARRYRCDWRKLPEKLGPKYRDMKAFHVKVPGFRQTAVEFLAKQLRMPEQRIWERLQKPWALRQLLLGQWAEVEEAEEAIASEVELRLTAGVQIARLMEMGGVPLRELIATLKALHGKYEQEKNQEQGTSNPGPDDKPQ